MEYYNVYTLDDIKGEVWKDVRGHEGEYKVSNYGRVKSISRTVNTWNGYKTLPDKILSQTNRNGYLRCAIGNVHRIVAMAFLETSDYSLQVNHIDGNKKNNTVENLEWCTPSENIMHGWKNGLYNEDTRKKMSLKASSRVGNKNNCWRGYVKISDLEGNVLNVSETLKDAQEWVRSNTIYKKADKGNISLVCNGKLKKMYGLLFEYVKEI